MICYYTEHIGQVIYITVMHFFIRFVISREVYNQFLQFESTFNECIYILSIFVFNLTVAVLFAYIPSLQEKTRRTIVQNAKLLNGMHEGLLILSKFDKSILFVNRPAQKLLTSVIDFEEPHSGGEAQNLEQQN